MSQFIKEAQHLQAGWSARDDSGKPEVEWMCVMDGLVADSPVPLRLAWQAAKKIVTFFE